MNVLLIEFYGDPCRSCKFDWSAPDELLTAEILHLDEAYRSILDGLPGTAKHPGLTWNASEYVLHVAENLRQHGERMAAAIHGVAFEFVVSDPNEVSRARNYATVPIEGALWSLKTITGPYVEVLHEALALDVALPHPDRGVQRASAVLHGNAHDAHHHGWDLQRIAASHLP